MASLDSSLSEADRMAQGACDGAETMRPDYASSGGFIGTGPDSARHGSAADGSQSFMRTPVQSGWAVQHDASQNPYGAAHATPQQRMDPFKPDPTFPFGTAPDARVSPPQPFKTTLDGLLASAYDATQNPSESGISFAAGRRRHQRRSAGSIDTSISSSTGPRAGTRRRAHTTRRNYTSQ